jgi:hypothetical protein
MPDQTIPKADSYDLYVLSRAIRLIRNVVPIYAAWMASWAPCFIALWFADRPALWKAVDLFSGAALVRWMFNVH